MLTEHNVLPIALGDNWIYALPSSEGVLLIDAGPDYDGAWDALQAQLDAAGLGDSEIWGIVITHAHIDHCGLAARWQERGRTIFGSEAEFPRFAQGDQVIGFQSDLVFALMADSGVPPDRIANFREGRRRMREAFRKAIAAPQPSAGGETATAEPDTERLPETKDAKPARRTRRERWPGMIRGTPFQPQHVLSDGDVLNVGERTIHFIEAPGHTPGNAVCYEPATGALFSGDQLLPHVTPNPGIHFATDGSETRFRSLPAFTRSMEKVRELGASHLYPGHGEYVPEVAPIIERTLEHHRKRQDRIRRFLRAGPLTPYAVLLKFFPHLPDGRLWQATGEIVGHIDALLEAGVVAEERNADGQLLIRLS